MKRMSYYEVEKNLEKVLNSIDDESETILVTRAHKDNIILLAESEYNNLIENLYIRKNTTFYKDLIDSINQIKK